MVVWWCVVWWCGVFVQDFRGCAQDLGALPRPPSATPPSAGPPKISLFFPSRHNFHSFFLSWGGPFVEFWWCLKRWGPEMCTFGVLGLSCEAPAAPQIGLTRTGLSHARPLGPPPPPPLPSGPPSSPWTPPSPAGHEITESSHGGSTFDTCSDKASVAVQPPVVQDSPRTAQSRPRKRLFA